MCGISGFIDYRNISSGEILLNMQNTLKHRGPDDQGLDFNQFEDYQIGLGHSRLSIIDTSSLGHQPMKWQKFTIVFNGEVYNFNEVKSTLTSLGHQFISHSDTEVVLHAFAQWGMACVEYFIGMFAFCVYDSENQVIYLCRDRAGVKPLFWYWDRELFLFGSELKPFHKHPGFKKEINKEALQLFLGYGYVPAPLAIFSNTQKLLPAHWLKLSLKSRTIEFKKYWDIADYTNKRANINYDLAKSELNDLIKSACNYRMVADVPVGVFLSGGYDSSLVAAVLQKERTDKLKTFTIGFWKGTDEAPFAKKVAEYLGTDHQEYYCTEKDAQSIIPELSHFYDEPNADISNIPTILVSRLAKQKVKVALSADGGDELFSGYSGSQKQLDRFHSINKLPFKNLFKQLLLNSCHILKDEILEQRWIKKRNLLISVLGKDDNLCLNELLKVVSLPPFYLVNHLLNSSFKMNSGFPVISAYTKEIPKDIEAGNLLLIRSFESAMIDLLLVKVDRATMSASLEGREPLLDHRLIEYATSLPYRFKNDGSTSKKILKDIAHSYIPKELLERPKAGFDLPLFDWLNGDLGFIVDEYLSKEKIQEGGYFDANQVNELVRQFRDKKLAYKDLFWRLIVFQMWIENDFVSL